MQVQLDFGAELDIASGDELKLMGDSVVSRLRPKTKRVLRRIIPASTVMPASGPALLDFGQVPAGTMWAIVHCVITGGDDHTSLVTATTNNQASNTFAGAAAGAVALPTNGESITGFDVDFVNAAATVNGLVTVTNVAGGTLNYEVTVTTSGGQLSVRYPNPLPASAVGVAPTVNVPAIVGGSAYTVTVYGQAISGSAGVASLYFGGVAPAGNLANSLPILGSLLEPGIAVPAVWRYSKEIATGHDGDGLYALVYGAAVNTNLMGVARVYEWHPDGSEEASFL